MDNTPRKWYKKKRYIIPSVFIAGIIAIANMSDPAEQPLENVQENNLVAPDSQTAPKNVIPDEIQMPNEVEEKVTPPKPIPAPTPNPVPTPKPTPVPVATPNPKSNCDPNYSGCVPIASDVDCAGGNGNGPAYVRGPVYVTGSDIYDLDRDGDGVGCDS